VKVNETQSMIQWWSVSVF